MKIGIVNSGQRETELIKRALQHERQHEVAWSTQNAEEAVTLCARQTPDLVLMDLLVPSMGGVEATRRIMSATPCAILIMAEDVGTHASQIFEAMAQGAVDAIDTPRPDAANWRVSVASFLVKLDVISRRLPGGEQPSMPIRANAPLPVAPTLVAIGASAGGPDAVRTVLHGLPKDFAAAVVVVQHMDQRFAPGMVEWLSGHTDLPIRIAQERDMPVAGVVLLAGTNDHLILKGQSRLGYTLEPADYVYRPSVDVFFQSVARHWTGRVAAVLLTGMGRDGAAGLKQLRDQGHYTIAQDQTSSAVFGMPKAAIEQGAAMDVIAVNEIAGKLVNILSSKNEWTRACQK